MLISPIGLLEPIQNQDHGIIPGCPGNPYRFIHTKCPLSLFAAQADAGDPTGTGHGSALGQPTLNVFVAEVWQKSPAGVKL